VLIARTRTRIKTGKLDEAGELIGQLLRLENSRQELARTLAVGQRALRASDPGVQRKFDALFDETQKTLHEYLRPEVIEQLRRELRSAQAAAGS
jgi:hypothetical protein